MSQQQQPNSITIQKPRCPRCGEKVKAYAHKGDVRYFDCRCGNRFKGVVT